ncbi:acidic endochitinase-like [Prosopis cineraria]|uniref:acidic endochitinase-like n=1 Tax=Prosopis cineraria TaxID=364024 RepID=UPI00240FB8C0|nr:acidic endochitinase-like [Prosopis cineraria]
MASKTRASSIILLLPLLLLSQCFCDSDAYERVTYWGQNAKVEGDLVDACYSEAYEIINIAFLDTFGNAATPTLNLTGHCGDSSPNKRPCTEYASQIKACQEHGVKIFLSLGGYYGNYQLASVDEAKQLAEYLWNNFLGGQTESELPLGNVVLDGIDFFIKHGLPNFYDTLAKQLHAYSQEKKFYLSAAPHCEIKDKYLYSAIKTGAFDKLHVLFYEKPSCLYQDANTSKFLTAWDSWADKYPSPKLYAAVYPIYGRTYNVPLRSLNQKLIPVLKSTRNFGGVVVSNRSDDVQTGDPTYCYQIDFDQDLQSAPTINLMMPSA